MDALRELILSKNKLVVRESNARNIIFVGRARCGKSSAIQMLMDPSAVERAASIFRGTKEATVYPFCVEKRDPQNPDLPTVPFNLNVIDTPGLFERVPQTQEDMRRGNDKLLDAVRSCLEKRITKIHSIFFVFSVVDGVKAEDVASLEMFAKMFSGATANISLLVTNAEAKTELEKLDLLFNQLAKTELFDEAMSLAATSRRFRVVRRVGRDTVAMFAKIDEAVRHISKTQKLLVLQDLTGAFRVSSIAVVPSGILGDRVEFSLSPAVSEAELTDEQSQCELLLVDEMVLPFTIISRKDKRPVRSFSRISEVAKYCVSALNLGGTEIAWWHSATLLSVIKLHPEVGDDGKSLDGKPTGPFAKLPDGLAANEYEIISNAPRAFFSGVIDSSAVSYCSEKKAKTQADNLRRMRALLLEHIFETTDAAAFDLRDLPHSRASRDTAIATMSDLRVILDAHARQKAQNNAVAVAELEKSLREKRSALQRTIHFLDPDQTARADALARSVSVALNENLVTYDLVTDNE